MHKHHTQSKEQKTKQLLQRALDFLIEATEPVSLNGKEYKKINFSYGQLLHAMQHFATTQEIVEGAIITSASTFSKSEDYKTMITLAKTKRAEESLSKNGNLTLSLRKLSELDYQIEIQHLIVENDTLKERNEALESFIKQAELTSSLKENSELTNKIEFDNNHDKILSRLIALLSADGFVYPKPAKNGKPAEIYYDGETSARICLASDIESLGLSFKEGKNGIEIVAIEGNHES